MLTAFAVMCGGLLILTYGADRFVEGAAAVATNLGVPALLVGLVIVGFATSAPEMLVAAVAAWQGNPALGIGNALGSNITNVGLVLGVTALWMPMTVRSDILGREFPLLFVVLAASTLALWDDALGRGEGILLLGGMGLMMAATVWLALHVRRDDPIIAEIDHELPPRMSGARATVWLALGLALLLVGSRFVVNGAVDIAARLGISDVVIGLSVVAVGTSLPELAASLASAWKNEPDIALGNVLGSNMFNGLGVLGMPALIAPAAVEPAVLQRDVPCMLLFTLALFLMCRPRRGRQRIGRRDGVILLSAFVAYQVMLFLDH
ncbi:MAG: calcium/sodium antiporter [Gammaproteobacteria bacterium]